MNREFYDGLEKNWSDGQATKELQVVEDKNLTLTSYRWSVQNKHGGVIAAGMLQAHAEFLRDTLVNFPQIKGDALAGIESGARS